MEKLGGGGGNSFFNCGTSDSRGVGILLGKKFKENVEFFSQDNSGRILIKSSESTKKCLSRGITLHTVDTHFQLWEMFCRS
jgi:hypothetical protein